MTEETRKTLLHGQLQERLRYVSGARDYQELCIAVKNEERRLNELNKRQQYLIDNAAKDTTDHQHKRFHKPVQREHPQGSGNSNRFNPEKNIMNSATPSNSFYTFSKYH